MKSALWAINSAILAVVICGCSGPQPQNGTGKLTIYYVPIGIETLTPVTSANIEERGRRCEIRSILDIEKIKSELSAAAKSPSRKFSDMTVRVKIFETSAAGDGLLAVLENEGEVRFSDGTERSLSPGALKNMKKIIETKCKQ